MVFVILYIYIYIIHVIMSTVILEQINILVSVMSIKYMAIK